MNENEYEYKDRATSSLVLFSFQILESILYVFLDASLCSFRFILCGFLVLTLLTWLNVKAGL